MTKKITFLKTMLLAIVMMVGSMNAWAQATLPFSYDLGKPTATTGLTHTGLGTDYAATPKMKFDTQADNLILNFSGTPGTLTFSIKWNQSTAVTRFPGDFTLQESVDGISYTTVQLYNSTSGSALAHGITVSETITTLLSTSRFIKWNYTAKSNGNIAIGAINLSAGSATATPTLTVAPASLTGFTYNYGSVIPSAEQSFTVGGADLTNDVIITAPANYEISSTSGVAFAAASPITISTANANAGATTIYTRLKAGLNVASYNENISISSVGATAKQLACTGSVACIESGLAFAAPSVIKVVGDAAFSQLATSSSATAITYISSAPGFATVNATTGEVTLISAGVTTITASQAAGAGYCASTASYLLTITSTTPTIKVVEITITDMAATVGSTDTETINVSGVNLTDKIDLAITGTNADQYSLSSKTIAQTDGSVLNTAITITYTPTSAGTHTAELTLSSSAATPVTFSLNASATWAPLTTPVATSGTNITENELTTNWESVAGATSYDLDVYTKVGGGVVTETESFSELTPDATGKLITTAAYLTGWSASSQSSTRQIYTTTGNFGLTSPSLAFTTTGDFIETATYNSPIKTLSFWAKQQTGATSSTLVEGYNGSAWSIIATLSNADVATAGTVSYDLVALGKSDITKIKMTYTKVVGNLSVDDVKIEAGAPASTTSVAGYPVTGITDVFKTVTGLTAGTEYFFTVTAKNTNVTSLMSNEISITTDTITGLEKIYSSLSVSVVNGKIQVNAVAGETVNIYNAIGQLLLSKITVEGTNTIAVASHGVLIVKVGNHLSKVIL